MRFVTIDAVVIIVVVVDVTVVCLPAVLYCHEALDMVLVVSMVAFDSWRPLSSTKSASLCHCVGFLGANLFPTVWCGSREEKEIGERSLASEVPYGSSQLTLQPRLPNTAL